MDVLTRQYGIDKRQQIHHVYQRISSVRSLQLSKLCGLGMSLDRAAQATLMAAGVRLSVIVALAQRMSQTKGVNKIP